MFFHFLSFSFTFFHVLSCFFMFFHVLSFSFIFFHVLSCSFIFCHFISLFFFLFFLFFLYFPFVFLLKKCFFLFHFVSLFSFLGCSKSVAALQDSLGKSAHSELALFALYWLVVTFPCGIVHILVNIRLESYMVGGGWVKSHLRSRIVR